MFPVSVISEWVYGNCTFRIIVEIDVGVVYVYNSQRKYSILNSFDESFCLFGRDSFFFVFNKYSFSISGSYSPVWTLSESNIQIPLEKFWFHLDFLICQQQCSDMSTTMNGLNMDDIFTDLINKEVISFIENQLNSTNFEYCIEYASKKGKSKLYNVNYINEMPRNTFEFS